MRVDFRQFKRICQLEKYLKLIFLLNLFYGCSHEVIVDDTARRKIEPLWMRVDENFALRGKDNEFLVNAFYDINPNIGGSEIRYITTTPKESKYLYSIDPLSGSLYQTKRLCKTKDIWDNYSSKVFEPIFDIGAIPRVYDQLNDPQKIFVFKDSPEISKFEYNIKTFQEASLIGSFLLEKCDSYPCSTKEKWKQFQVLLGVNKNDPKMENVNSLADLKAKTDWNYVRAFLVNQYGSHQLGSNFYPAYRILSELDRVETLKHLKKNSNQVDMVEASKLRDSCMELYNDMWKKVTEIRSLKFNQQDDFFNFFKIFYEKQSDRYYQCQKLIRPANINIDPERHWFFTYITAFIDLYKSGLYYNCNLKSWAYNPRVDEERFFVDQNKELARCRTKDFEKSFDQAINGISLLKSQLNRSIRYIEYDSVPGGSHQKIYSWIIEDRKKIQCEDDKFSYDIFPQDVVWPSFKEDEEKTVH